MWLRAFANAFGDCNSLTVTLYVSSWHYIRNFAPTYPCQFALCCFYFFLFSARERWAGCHTKRYKMRVLIFERASFTALSRYTTNKMVKTRSGLKTDLRPHPYSRQSHSVLSNTHSVRSQYKYKTLHQICSLRCYPHIKPTFQTLPPEIQYMIIREMFNVPKHHLQDLLSLYYVCNSWRELIDVIIRCDKYVRMILLHFGTRENRIEAIKDFIKKFDIDVNTITPQVAEVPEYENVWTIMHTACVHGHLEIVKLLADEFGALEGKCKDYISDLICMAAYRGNINVWLALEKYID